MCGIDPQPPHAPCVDLARFPAITHAFVGADLEALCKEAGMVAPRRYLSLEDKDEVDTILTNADRLQITMDGFLKALREVEPTTTSEVYTERSTVAWRNIGGLREIKDAPAAIRLLTGPGEAA